MARGKTTETVTGEQTRAIQTQRVTSLEAKGGKALTSLEEAVVRMHHGVSVKGDAVLATNGVTDELMAKLLEMEVQAFEKSGRGDELDDAPSSRRPGANARTAKLVADLKKRS
jgi:hypothetical protein